MNKKYPKVSIVIPVYNGSDYLNEAIESALAQDYLNYEVIVINDGSTDHGKTEKVVKKFGKKVRYIKKENGGVATALNRGIEEMRGEWFSWLSHDDVYPADRLSKLMRVWQKNKQARFIYGQLKNIDETGRHHPLLTDIYDFVADKKIPLVRQLFTDDLISGCTTLIHKSVFDDVGTFNKKNKTAQDYDMWLRIAAKYEVFRCPFVVIKRRVHSHMGTITMKSQVIIDTKLAITDAVKQIPIELIFNDVIVKESPKVAKAYCYRQLGNLIVGRWHWFDLAQECYQKSRKLDDSLDSSIYEILGPRLINSPTLLRQLLRSYYWRLRRLITNEKR